MSYKQFKAWEEARAGWVFICSPARCLSTPLGASKEGRENFLARVIFHTKSSSCPLQRCLSTSVPI